MKIQMSLQKEDLVFQSQLTPESIVVSKIQRQEHSLMSIQQGRHGYKEEVLLRRCLEFQVHKSSMLNIKHLFNNNSLNSNNTCLHNNNNKCTNPNLDLVIPCNHKVNEEEEDQIITTLPIEKYSSEVFHTTFLTQNSINILPNLVKSSLVIYQRISKTLQDKEALDLFSSVRLRQSMLWSTTKAVTQCAANG